MCMFIYICCTAPPLRDGLRSPTLEATPGHIWSQSPTDANSGRWHLKGDWLKKPSVCPWVVSRVAKVSLFFMFFITFKPRVEWDKSQWDLNTSPSRNHYVCVHHFACVWYLTHATRWHRGFASLQIWRVTWPNLHHIRRYNWLRAKQVDFWLMRGSHSTVWLAPSPDGLFLQFGFSLEPFRLHLPLGWARNLNLGLSYQCYHYRFHDLGPDDSVGTGFISWRLIICRLLRKVSTPQPIQEPFLTHSLRQARNLNHSLLFFFGMGQDMWPLSTWRAISSRQVFPENTISLRTLLHTCHFWTRPRAIVW